MAVSKSPLSSLFWSNSRFKLRSDLGYICWRMGKTLPGRADNFGPQHAVPDFDEQLIDFKKFVFSKICRLDFANLGQIWKS